MSISKLPALNIQSKIFWGSRSPYQELTEAKERALAAIAKFSSTDDEEPDKGLYITALKTSIDSLQTWYNSVKFDREYSLKHFPEDKEKMTKAQRKRFVRRNMSLKTELEKVCKILDRVKSIYEKI